MEVFRYQRFFFIFFFEFLKFVKNKKYYLKIRSVIQNKIINYQQQLSIQTKKLNNSSFKYLNSLNLSPIPIGSVLQKYMQNSINKTTEFLNNLSLSNRQRQQSQLQDPFLNEGGQLFYDEEHDFVIRMQQKPNQVQTLKNLQKLRVKILVIQLHGVCKSIKIQLTSDTQLYFNFIFTCTDWQFKRIKENQSMFIDFKEYPDVIIKTFQKLKNQTEDSKFLAVFTVFTQKQGKLDIIRKAEFRDDSILEFDFFKANEQMIKLSIQYRYDLMREQNVVYTSKYQQITEAIKAKNPSLMMQISKTMKKGK